MNIRILIFALVLFLILPSCEKNDHRDIFEPAAEDYREAYLGKYEFETQLIRTTMCYDTSPPCVNGWKKELLSVKKYMGSISEIDSNRLHIPFGLDTVAYVNDLKGNRHLLTQNVIMTLNQNGKLNYMPLSNATLIGEFTSEDSISIYTYIRFGMGGYYEFFTQGVKRAK